MFKKIAVVLALVQVLTITTTSTAEAQRRRQSPMDRACLLYTSDAADE